MTNIKIIFGSSENMKEISSSSIHLVITSPPYYNAPFDFPNLFSSYDEFLKLLKSVGKELLRILQPGRYACFVTQDVRIEGRLYPVVADLIHVMVYEVGFEYQEKIIWKKPEGYIRISRRSGVLIQHPYPMYFYPDNIYEEIVVFKKPGEFNKTSVPEYIKEKSKIDIGRFQAEKWYLTVWNIKNVLPAEKWSKYTAAFPEELVERLIRLYSYREETVLDPFLGTGTTCVVARRLGRNCIGYEIDLELIDVIKERLGVGAKTFIQTDSIEIIVREDTRRLRTKIREEIEQRLKNKNNKQNQHN
jgi:site-specific DNA-methyltransferase (adenine-specific)/site-specific DNA-methyltransferase (cytosine-N4-specific)